MMSFGRLFTLSHSQHTCLGSLKNDAHIVQTWTAHSLGQRAVMGTYAHVSLMTVFQAVHVKVLAFKMRKKKSSRRHVGQLIKKKTQFGTPCAETAPGYALLQTRVLNHLE